MRKGVLALASLGTLFHAAAASGLQQRMREETPDPNEMRPEKKSKAGVMPKRQYYTHPEAYRRAKNSAKFQKGDTLGIHKEDLERLRAAQERRERQAAKRGA